MKTVLCITTAGKGSRDSVRVRRLTAHLPADIEYFELDRSGSRVAASKAVWDRLKAQKWDLVFQEGTGIAGGLNLIRAALAWQQPFVVSSGDPVGGFFYVTKGPLVGGLFELYEKLLYRTCSGFVGWTPYLTGAALKMGAQRAVTVEGAVEPSVFSPCSMAEKRSLREKYGLPAEHIVCGVVGSLKWSDRQSYCYGLELVEALKYVKRTDVSMLIVGDGDGRDRLEASIPDHLRERVVFTGRVPEAEVVETINAMDIGFVTQTLDQLGNYRLTTKLPEYLACGVPVAMSPIPGFYDYAEPAGWALPAAHPASDQFHRQCAGWLDALSPEEIADKASHTLELVDKYFDYGLLSDKLCSFLSSFLE